MADYVLSVLVTLWQMQKIPERPNIAIVGVGAVGRQVQRALQAFSLDIQLCDPLRARAESNFPHIPLLELTDIDVFCFHVPLTLQGADKTFHLLEKIFLTRQKSDCVILNASRGEILESSLIPLFSRHLHFCLDVFEGEPNIDVSILSQVCLATPHIAGHSMQSKMRGVVMARDACARFFGMQDFSESQALPKREWVLKNPTSWQEVILSQFNPASVSAAFIEGMRGSGANFDVMRKHFPLKSELAHLSVLGSHYLDAHSKACLQHWGVACV